MDCVRVFDTKNEHLEMKVSTFQSQEKSIVQIYTDWANHYLERGRFKHYIQDLQTDVSDGSLLADVIEAVTGTCIPNIARKPKTATQMVENINACLNFLDELGVNVIDITAQDIRDGSLKAILGLFFNLSRYKQARKTAASADNQPSSCYSQGKVGLTSSTGGEMLSKLPAPSKPSTGRVRENSSSIPAPPSTVNNNRKSVNQTEKSRNLTNPGDGMMTGTTGSSGFPSKAPPSSSSSVSAHSSGIPHGSFIPQPRSGVVTRDKGSLERNHSRPSSSSSTSSASHLPIKSISGVALRNSPGVTGIDSGKSATNHNNSGSDKLKPTNYKDKQVEKSGVFSKRTSSSSGFSSARSERSDSSTSLCSDPRISSSTDGSDLLSAASGPSPAPCTPSMSTQGIASRSDAAVKNLAKRTPGSRNSSGVRQTISKPTSTGRKDVESSRIIQAKNANGSRIVNSGSLPRRGDISGTGSLPRLKNNEGECGRCRVGGRTEASSQNQEPSDGQGQLCKSIQPDNPIRQSKISSLIPKTERAIKTASSGSVGSVMDTGSVCGDGIMADKSITYCLHTDRSNAQVSAQETVNSGIPKPTAAVKGTSKPPKEESRHSNAPTSNVTQSVSSSSVNYLSIPRPIMSQESHTPVKLSRDDIYVPVEINRQILENRQVSNCRQPEENGSTSSLPKSDRSVTERTREGSQGTISVAKVSPIMNTNISNATKEKSTRQQDNLEERRPENSNVPMQASQTRRGSEGSQRESNPISDNCSRNSKSRESDSVKPEVIPSAEMVTEIKNRRSAVKDVPKETDGPSCDTEASFGEEADDVIVNIKPMQPITRASTYGYIRSLGPFPATRNFANKLQSPGLRLLTDFSGTGGGRLGLSRQILTTGDSSRIYGIPIKRTFSTSKGVLDIDYSSDVDSVDLAAGYMSDGDVLRPGLVYKVDDIASGYMSEGGASLYGRKVSSKTKDSIFSDRGAAPRTINVLQDDRSIKPCPLRSQYKSSLDDSSSISSGISDTIAEFSTDDNMTGSSVSSETNLYCTVKKTTQRDELPSSYATPSSVSKEKSNSNRKVIGANTKGSSSGRSSNVKKTDSSMQTESSAFQQMSSAAWKKYLQQRQQEHSQSEEGRSGHNRARNVELESGKIRDKKSSSSGSSSKKNSVCNGSFEKYNGSEGHKSRQKTLVSRSEESKQQNLLDNEYPGEKLYRNGRSSSPKPSKIAPDTPPQGSRDVRKVQGSRPLAVSGPSLGSSIIKRPTSTSSVSSSGSVKSSGSRGYGSRSNTLDKMMEVANCNECDSVGVNRTLFQTSNIPSNEALSYQTDCMPNSVGKGSERKTKVKVSANTQTNAQDLYMIGSSAHSDGEYNSLGRRSSAKNYALMSPTLSLRERVYGSNRPVLSGASTPSSDYVMLSGLHPSSKERSQHLPRFSSPLKHGDGDTGNYVTLDHPAVLSSLQSSSPSPYAWLRYSGGSTAGSVCSAPVTRGFNNGSLTEADSMESLSSVSSGVHGQGASRYMFPLSPVNPLTPSLCGSSSHSNIRGTATPYMGGLLSKLSNKDDEMHGSSLSLVSTASSLYLTTDEKHAHEIRKLRRELEQANEKVATLTSQLTTNNFSGNLRRHSPPTVELHL
ncbi:uncharacterized protein LOC143222893 isoform X2 [Tachypleus tridentatus]|uniref:uncharacterized protein LOC143222893 isoform X2 n=1 Tax=Tachypleus tridentatus TaxID=6853 RepID=UPI003FD6410B